MAIIHSPLRDDSLLRRVNRAKNWRRVNLDNNLLQRVNRDNSWQRVDRDDSSPLRINNLLYQCDDNPSCDDKVAVKSQQSDEDHSLFEHAGPRVV